MSTAVSTSQILNELKSRELDITHLYVADEKGSLSNRRVTFSS